MSATKDLPTNSSSFLSKTRDFFWPIYGGEHKHFLPMALMIGFILFNYSVVRNIKDTLILKSCPAETTSFLKLWIVTPSAVLFFLVYAKLTTRFSKTTLFYITILPFIIFFAAFAYVIYPNRELLHPVETAAWLKTFLPEGLFGFADMYGYWTFSLFYVLAELWGSAILSFLFWQFANDVTNVKHAKRFYPHFYLLGNFFVLGAGLFIVYFNQRVKAANFAAGAWNEALNFMLGAVVTLGLGVVAIYYLLNRGQEGKVDLVETAGPAPAKKQKPKLSMGESLKFLLKSRYLGLIAILVMAYGISINLTEVMWKSKQKLLYGANETDLSEFGGWQLAATGISTVIVILLGSAIVRRLGWKRGALATPYILGGSSLLFFAFVIFEDTLSPIFMNYFSLDILFMTVWFGFAQNVLAKSTKYALFDPTKEMAYIPLDAESKSKGKAAVDVVGARLGKSGGGLLMTIMLSAIGPIAVLGPYSAAIVLGIIIIWIAAVHALNVKFKALTGEK